ncbi:beta strand repeat-containing protein, partial [Sphingopyxis sp.]|uniref:beta strand repeat-containing protein n=1 Tax=Sphingopyxis sp. TaxID=1908224 RepID=UPI0035B34482
GGAVGGTVHLVADGGTITSNGAPLTVTAGGVSGIGGDGGTGSGGNGAGGSTVVDQGGRVVFEALATSNPGQINLGDTVIQANGGLAGRIEMRSGGSIAMNSLTAEALGLADPTNNDTGAAPAGIFFATTGGTISTATAGDMTLRTDSSIGVYGQSGGQVSAGGNLTIDAGDQVDIRHDNRGEAANPTLFATGNLAISAVTGISGAPGSLLSAGNTLTLATTGAGASIGVDRLAGGDIVVTTAGLAGIGHAEAVDDFTANAGSFRTGLNTIITGGDISVTAAGTIDLGNSTAGGSVYAAGQSIAFNTVTAGTFVNFFALGTGAGDGIFGNNLTAQANSITMIAPRIGVTGTLRAGTALRATGTAGDVAFGLAEVGGDISIFAQTNLSGVYRAGGNINLVAGGNATVEADAAGGYAPPTGGPASEGYVFVDAGGNATLTDSSAATMLGVRAGGAASLNGAAAGEDVFVLAGTTATLSNISAGDDLTVQAPGAISVTNAATTGTGPDGRSVVYASSSPSPGLFLQTAATPADLSNIMLSGGANITAANVNAFDNLTATAAGALTAAGPLVAGNDVVITANAVTLADIPSSGDPIDTIRAGRDIAIASASDISGGGTLNAGRNLTLDAAGSIAITGGESGAGGQMTLTGITGIDADRLYSRGTTTLTADNGAVRVGSLSSLGDVSVSANSLDIGTNGPITFANIVTDVGDATIGSNNRLIVDNATIAGTARFGNSGEHMIIRNLTAAAAEFNANEMLSMTSVSVTNDLSADAGTTIAIDGVVTGRNISLASADIDIAASGRVGTAGVTQGLTLANNDDGQQTFVGGTGSKDGYHIDADELTRLFGTDIGVFAPAVNAVGPLSVGSPTPPDVIVDSFTMTGGAQGSNLGAGGSLTIRTPGKMRVVGNVQLTGLSDDNALGLIADDALEVILGQGSVRLLGANNAPGGRLNMASDDIIVATEAAIADVANAATTDAINTRLGQNDGVTLDEGALFARGIRFSAGGGVYVQNSGAGTDFGQRRGLTFGAGGLTIQTSGPSRIVINGVHLGPNGQVTGLDTIPLLTIAPGSTGTPGSFDPRSTFNGCLIANTGSCTAVSFDPGTLFPVQDVVEEEADSDGDSGDGTSLPTALITMRDLDPLSGEPLLDDPVTGAGNDDLWTPITDSQQP